MAFNFKKVKFLVVDDFGNYRSMVKTLLRSAGALDIDDASNGTSAIEKIKRKKYDVILCDYNLGDCQDGQQILEEVMHRGLIGYTTIFIMITAENTMNMVMAAVEYKPDEYLTKPFTKEVLSSRLEKLVVKKNALVAIYNAADKKNYERALELCDQEINQHPRLALDIVKVKADVCLKCGNLALAEKVYRKALSIRNFTWAKLGLGKIRLEQERYEEAQEILEEVIEESKTCMEAYDLLAITYEKDGNLKEAQQLLTTATQLSPSVISRQKSLGALALKNGSYNLAEKSYRSAVKIGKHSYLKSSSDYVGLAKAQLENGAPRDALKSINNVQKEFRGDTSGLVQSKILESVIYKRSGMEKQAKAAFEIAMKDYSETVIDVDESVTLDMAKACEDFGETEMAEAIQQDLEGTSNTEDRLKRVRKYRGLQLNREGIALYEKGKAQEAIEIFMKAVETLPENVSILMNATQGLIEQMAATGKEDDKVAIARRYLDQVKVIDADNEKYQQLEKMYEQLIG